MKKILIYLTMMVIILGLCSYKLSEIKQGYVTHVTEESIAIKAIESLEKTKDQNGKVDFDKAQKLLAIVGERDTSIFYVDIFYKTSLFFMVLFLLSGTYYEVKKLNQTSKGTQ